MDAKVSRGSKPQLGLLTITVRGCGISHSHRDEGDHKSRDKLHCENGNDVEELGASDCWANEKKEEVIIKSAGDNGKSGATEWNNTKDSKRTERILEQGR